MADDWSGRDLGDEATGALRDRAPDPLGMPDPDAPVSGHRPVREPSAAASAAPEHDWSAARALVFPVLRAPGTVGAPADVPLDVLRSSSSAHTVPLVADGPCGLVVAFAMAGGGYEVMVNGDHLLSWGVDPGELAAVAGANLAAWSAGAPWSEEVAGTRRLLSSDTGSGHDAARILLDEVRAHLVRELLLGSDPGTRLLIGLPDQHLLVAGTMVPGDEEFGPLFHDFVVEQSGGADDPVDRRIFELVGGELVEFSA